LIGNQFDCLALVIAEMNGGLLYDLYQMCNELSILEKNATPLTVFVYLRFLQEIQKFSFIE
jgi:hypothetical protein